MQQLLVRHGEGADRQNLLPQILQRYPVGGVDRKEPLENVQGVVRDGQDGPEEVGIVDVCSECLIRGSSLAPGVATACEVDEDHAKGPQVVVLGRVPIETVVQPTLTFWG